MATQEPESTPTPIPENKKNIFNESKEIIEQSTIFSIFKSMLSFIGYAFGLLLNSNIFISIFKIFKNTSANSKVIINKSFIKHYNTDSILDIIKQLLNYNIHLDYITKVRNEMNELSNYEKSQKLTFPLPKLEDEPESVSNPVYIKYILHILLTIIVCIIIFLIIYIFVNTVYYFKYN